MRTMSCAIALALTIPSGAFAQTAPAPSPTETTAINVRGFRSPAYGRWLTAKDAHSGVPLGGLGTGFIELRPDAMIHDSVLRNNWTSPRPPASCALTLSFPGANVPPVGLLSSASDKPPKQPGPAVRYFGHFPIADLDYGRPGPQAPVTASLRAFSPFVPRDAEASNLPAAIFAVDLKNQGSTKQPIALTLRWSNDLGASDRTSGNVDGMLGWKRGALPPGARWIVSCAHVLAGSDAGLQTALSEAKAAAMPSLPELAKCCTLDDGRLARGKCEFVLDAWGGSNWEATKQETASLEGTPTVGQILYAIRWGSKTAHVEFASGAPNSAVELKCVAPLRVEAARHAAYAQIATEDGALLITQVCAVTNDALVRWFIIENRSGKPIADCAFGYYANADVGGATAAETGGARWREVAPGVTGIDFTGPKAGLHHLLASWAPAATHAVVGTWPDTPALMRTFNWPPVASLTTHPGRGAAFTHPSIAGVQMRSFDGRDTSAVAAWTTGWTTTTNPPAALGGVPGASVSLAGILAPGEAKRLWFAFAWHAPTWRSSDGKVCMNHYGAHYLDAAAVAARALTEAPDIERRIVAWQEGIYRKSYPDWLKDALVNGLYSYARNSIYLDDGRFFHSESFTGCPITETLVCRFNGSFATVEQFPELEKATMREFAKAQADTGQIAFGFGSPVGVATPMLDLQKPIVTSEFVLMARRDALWTGDRQFAKDIYPAVKSAMKYAMTLDTDNDGLINDAPGSESGFPANQYYDIWPWFGTSSYTGGIGLAALRAAEEMAKEQGDNRFAAWCRDLYEKGAVSFEEKLWNGSHYRLYNDFDHGRMSETCLANQLCGQLYAWACGLGDIHPSDNITSALRTVGLRNVRATRWGAVAGVKPDLTPDESGTSRSREVVVGETWNYAATALYAASRASDSGLRQMALTAAENAYKAILQSGTLWNQHFSYSSTDGSPVWGSHYYSDLCIWALPFAFETQPDSHR